MDGLLQWVESIEKILKSKAGNVPLDIDVINNELQEIKVSRQVPNARRLSQLLSFHLSVEF